MKKFRKLVVGSLMLAQVAFIAPMSASAVEVGQTCSTITLTSGTSTQFKHLTYTQPSSSNDGLFTDGTTSAAVLATSTGFVGAWDAAVLDLDVSGASWISNSADQPNNPSDGNPGGNGSVNAWRLFSHSFTIPANASTISGAIVHFTGDNSVEAFLDNVSVGTSTSAGTVVDTQSLVISTGVHEFEFVVKNDAFDGADNPTGLIYKVSIDYCVPSTPTPTSGSISGTAYNDLNRNKLKDPNEPGLQGRVIKLFLDGQNKKDTLIATTTTDVNGNYSFTKIAPGTYEVREKHLKGWKRTSKNPKDIVISSDSVVTGVDFGNAAKQKKEKEDNEQDDNRDEQNGRYYCNRGKSNYAHDQHKKEHANKDNNHGKGRGKGSRD